MVKSKWMTKWQGDTIEIVAGVNDIEEHNDKPEGQGLLSHSSLAGAKDGVNRHSVVVAKLCHHLQLPFNLNA